jgi:hypothetical protein
VKREVSLGLRPIARDLERINHPAERMNSEAADVLD